MAPLSTGAVTADGEESAAKAGSGIATELETSWYTDGLPLFIKSLGFYF